MTDNFDYIKEITNENSYVDSNSQNDDKAVNDIDKIKKLWIFVVVSGIIIILLQVCYYIYLDLSQTYKIKSSNTKIEKSNNTDYDAIKGKQGISVYENSDEAPDDIKNKVKEIVEEQNLNDMPVVYFDETSEVSKQLSESPELQEAIKQKLNNKEE